MINLPFDQNRMEIGEKGKRIFTRRGNNSYFLCPIFSKANNGTATTVYTATPRYTMFNVDPAKMLQERKWKINAFEYLLVNLSRLATINYVCTPQWKIQYEKQQQQQ